MENCCNNLILEFPKNFWLENNFWKHFLLIFRWFFAQKKQSLKFIVNVLIYFNEWSGIVVDFLKVYCKLA